MLLGVNVAWDTVQPARLFIKVYKVAYPVGRDESGAITKAYQVEATPTSVFIDKRGHLAAWVEGAMEPAELTSRLEALLK